MSSVAVLGTGLVGRGWAIIFARAGYEVHLYDASESALRAARVEIGNNMHALRKNGLLESTAVETAMSKIHIHLDLAEAVKNVSYVQECISERILDKKNLLFALRALVSPQCIVASSTSALLPSELFAELENKEQCLVCHPVNPPYLIPLVEVVPSAWTNTKVVSAVMELMEKIGQRPILLRKEIPGFVLNRLQVALVNEAISLVRQGVATVEEVDCAVRDGLGYRWSFMGPFETIDLNAPLGIADYLQRFTDMYALAGDSTCESPFSQSLLETLEEQRREILLKENIEERRFWRDQKLMDVRNFHSNV